MTAARRWIGQGGRSSRRVVEVIACWTFTLGSLGKENEGYLFVDNSRSQQCFAIHGEGTVY